MHSFNLILILDYDVNMKQKDKVKNSSMKKKSDVNQWTNQMNLEEGQISQVYQMFTFATLPNKL